MPSQLYVGTVTTSAIALIEEAASYTMIQSKFIKKGSFLPRWDVSHPDLWNNTTGVFDMQAYLHEYLQQYGLDFAINGNNLIEVIAWP